MVQTSIEKALLSQADFKGTYCYQALREGVNPILNLEGVGRVGLPLEEHTAKRIIERCEKTPACKGMGEMYAEDVCLMLQMFPNSN